MRIASPAPSPNSCRKLISLTRNAKNYTAISAAAVVTIRPVWANP